MHRRTFFGLGATAGLAALPSQAAPSGDVERQIIATGDGIPLSTAEYTAILSKLEVHRDNVSRDGVVAELEKRVAASLGKEYAVWMPTGTLANHLAMRTLAGNKRRVIVQQESHLYNDCGDCLETLSGLHMIPLGAGKAAFTLEEVESWAHRGAGSRVDVPIGALQIETPVRRKDGQRFPFEEIKKVTAWARANKVGTHLDGARLYIEAAHTGIPVKQYAALFDTVYVSTYKYFNAASGAVLAGPKDLLVNLYHTRRMFGAGLAGVWPFAAVAVHYFDGFEERYGKAVKTSETVIAGLMKDGNFEIERIPEGSNIFRFRVRGVNALVYQQRLFHAGITASAPVNEWFLLRVNETWNRGGSANEIIGRFRTAMG